MMLYAVNDEGYCVVCGERIKDRLFDHADDCYVGRDERNLFAHDEIVMCLREFENFMGPCPLHGSPDFINSIQQLHRWKALLTEAKNLCSEGLHKTPMRNNWSSACEALIKEIEEIPCSIPNPY